MRQLSKAHMLQQQHLTRLEPLLAELEAQRASKLEAASIDQAVLGQKEASGRAEGEHGWEPGSRDTTVRARRTARRASPA